MKTFYSLSLILSLFGGSYLTYNRYLKQYRNVRDIPTNLFKKKCLYGKVTAVGDGDNFHFYHLPSGFFGGWGWLRKIPELELNTMTKTTDVKTISKYNNSSHKIPSIISLKRIRSLLSVESSKEKKKPSELKIKLLYEFKTTPQRKKKSTNNSN